MRANQARLAERVGALPGLTLRRAERRRRRRRHLPDRVRARPPRSPPTRSTRCSAEGVDGDADLRPGRRRPPRLPVLEAGARRDRGSRAAARRTARARSTCSSARSTSTSRRSATSRTSTRSRSRSRRSPRGDPGVTVRVGVVGGGLVAQAEHLPYLSALRDRFTLAALAEPSATVREALGARYGIAGLHADYRVAARRRRPRRGRRLLAGRDARRGRARRARRRPARLRREADVHHARRRRRDRRRARPAREGRPGRDDEALRPGRRGDARRRCPDSADDLRYVSVVVNDPEFEPYFEPGDIVRGSDVPRELIDATRRQRGGAGRAGGRLRRRGRRPRVLARASSAACCTTSTSSTGCSSGWASRCRREVVAGDWWNEGRAVYGALRLQNGARVRRCLDPAARRRSSTARRSSSCSPTRCARSSSRRRG